MSTIAVINRRGENCGSFDIPDDLLVKDRGAQAVQDAVVALRAGQRAGTASVLGKGAVAGSNRKPWKQKGLGRARAGYRRSPLWRGGGVAFGPRPRSYAKSINRKTMQLAFRRVFTEKLAAGSLRVIDKFDLPDAKTKSMAQLLKDLALTGKVLVLAADLQPSLERAARNLPRLSLTRAQDVNVYQLLEYPVVLAEKAAMEAIMQRLQTKKAVAEK
ncbi:MAG: 50S ribosomal protein L4 [Kiritimatiellia bacterium]|jgi:large subunit ribosomal protein L4